MRTATVYLLVASGAGQLAFWLTLWLGADLSGAARTGLVFFVWAALLLHLTLGRR